MVRHGAAMPYLEIKLGPDTLLLRFVGRIDYVFGRLPRADVQLRDMKVSRLHTQFFIDSRGAAFVRDLGSSGGTFINNQRLRRGVVAPTSDGLKVRVGDATVTFYDGEPPVNAIEPPGRSEPRGLIRTNPRERYFEAEATVLAMDKVDPDTVNGPAESPPEINPADFADQPGDLAVKPAPKAEAKPAQAPKPAAPGPKKTKRDTGIVEAPWEKKESGKVQPVPQDKKVALPTPRAGTNPPPKMASAEIDEMGNFQAPEPAVAPPQAPPPAPRKPISPLPPRAPQPEAAPKPPEPEPDGLDETGRTSREPAVAESGAFRPPPPITGDMPLDNEEEPAAPRVGMPTVRLERPKLEDRQRAIDEEEAEIAASLKIPTAAVKPSEMQTEDDEDPAPQIGTLPKNDTPVASDEEEELTDDQITEYMGGSVSGRYGDVNFGGEQASDADDDEPDEVNFGAGAKIELDDDVDIDVDDEPLAPQEAPEPEVEEAAPTKEPNTSMLGGTTVVSEEAVGESSEAGDEPVAEQADAAPEPVSEVAPADTPANTDEADEVLLSDDVPTYGDDETPPPPTREGATEDRAFKPRKTRKLMKRRKDTAKITDKKNPTPLPEGAKTEHIPLPEGLRGGDQPVAAGAKTMFIPKPDDAKLSRSTEGIPKPERPTGKPRAVPENRERETLDDMAEGPGGDTVALPPAMMKQLQEEMKHAEANKRSEPPTIGDNPTVKTSSDEEDEEEFIIDDDYSFFTPPPPTRAAREAAKRAEQGDVIDASDFHKETDNLPADKKAASSDDPDTLVD